MANRRFHYDRAFEHYLRCNEIAYVAVDEAKRALHAVKGEQAKDHLPIKLKSFDFVVYSQSGPNLLIDVKGRKLPKGSRSFQNWVTRDDVECLRQWSAIFGEGFKPVFAFLFWCDTQPPAALFHEMFEYGDRWYAVLAISLDDYATHMTERSAKWETVNIPAKRFTQHAISLEGMMQMAR